MTVYLPDPGPDPHGKGERAVQFIRRLKHHDGALTGKPFRLADWQERIIRRIYGDTDAAGRRRIQTVAIWIPRKNGKTNIAAAIGLMHTVGPAAVSGGQVIVAAADRGQASLAYKAAAGYIRMDGTLQQRIRVAPSLKEMTNAKLGTEFKAISHEAYSKHGLNISCLIADEIHAWPVAEGRELWNVLTMSQGTQDEPLNVIISTAGAGTLSLAWDLWDYSHKVATGEIEDPTFLPVIFAADKDDDWQDEAVWRKANPAIGAGYRKIEEMRKFAAKAKHFPQDASDFRLYYLNQWRDGAPDPWIEPEAYAAQGERRAWEDLAGMPAWVGIDLSAVQDLTAAVAVVPSSDGGVDVFPKFFIPEAGLKRRIQTDKAPYGLWIEQGHVVPTPGNVVDYNRLHDEVKGWAKHLSIQGTGIDRWNSTATEVALTEASIPVVQFGQGFASMGPAVKAMKSLILSGQFRHGDNPVLKWCFDNVVSVRDDADNEKFSKRRSTARIDGAVAAAMAVGLASEEDDGQSAFNTDERPLEMYIV